MVSGSQTSGGRTSIMATRAVSLCFWESFSRGDVGDAAIVYFILGQEDLGQTEPMPEEITLASR